LQAARSALEIRHKNGHYYVYKVEGYYDKIAHKPKSRSLGCIGQIYEGAGFVPGKKKDDLVELMNLPATAGYLVNVTSFTRFVL
jgi:hypothetical protein